MTRSNWYVAYTYPRCETKVNRQIRDMGITSFLPIKQVERQWSDRIKKMEVPLFPSYLFIYTTPSQFHALLQIPELSRIISFGGTPAIVKDEEVEAIKLLVQRKVNIEPQAGAFTVGQRVKVMRGPLAGIEGLLIRKNAKDRFVVQVETLRQHIPFEVPFQYLRAYESVLL